jgi:peroxiredoxin
MPALEAYYQAHENQAFSLIGISSGDTARQVQAFVQQVEVSFPLWLDHEGMALRAFKNNALPSSYVIDKEGIVRLAWNGAVGLDMLEKHVTPLINE